MTYSLNVNRIFAPDTAVVHRDEEYESDGFEAIRDMQSRHFWYQGRHRFLLRALKTNLRRLERNEGLAAIDLGGGDGSLALDVASRLLTLKVMESVQITVVDFHGVAGSDDPRIRISNCTVLDRVTEPAEIVLASATLEHVPDCNAVFRKLFDRMAEGGYFCARTPWAVPLKRLVRKLDITYPYHVHDMGGGFWNRIARTFELRGKVLISGPSPLETSWSEHPMRALAATLLKAPARTERILLGHAKRKDPIWKFVGGWEMLFWRKCRLNV
jgi:hypothetical protein